MAAPAAPSADIGPIAPQRPHEILFGRVEGENRGPNPMATPVRRQDPWFWLRDEKREDPEILAHLQAENAFTERRLAHLETLRQELYEEHLGHLEESDENPAYRSGPWFYYTRTVQGSSYKLHCRKPAGMDTALRSPAEDAPEEVVLDENAVAEGHGQCSVDTVKLCPSHRLLAYAADFSGGEVYSIVIKDLETGQRLPDVLEGVDSTLAWSSDASSLYYCTMDASLRSEKLWRHRLGEPQSKDVCLFVEKDPSFEVSFKTSKSGRFLIISSSTKEVSEVRVLDMLAKESSEFHVVQPRMATLRYSVEHLGDAFLVLTNKGGRVNQCLMRVPVDAVLQGSGGQEAWLEALPYDSTMTIEHVEVFQDFVALTGRQEGLTQVWVMDAPALTPSSLRRLSFDEKLYKVELSVNKEFHTPFLRVLYSSFVTPNTWYDVDVREKASWRMTVVKREKVPNFDASKYTCSRMFAEAPDGVRIPISMVHLKGGGLEAGRPQPCNLYAYGSYGVSRNPSFDRLILPFLDRGGVYCMVHVRGGSEMGRGWYVDQAKYLNKRNTFSDFIACAEHLVAAGLTLPHLTAIEGGSAGGLLIGAVLNMRPDLFRVATARVPFVDVMATMCDSSLTSTVAEWQEWGNPNEWKYFDYMLSYSPYDNVRAQPYPDILIAAGLHDPRVPYWEAAKWASKLRLHNTSPSSCTFLRMDVQAGHFSASDRYRHLRIKAFDQALVLEKLGLLK